MLGQHCTESVVLDPSRIVPMCVLHTKNNMFCKVRQTRVDPLWVPFWYHFGAIWDTFCLQGLAWRLQIGVLKKITKKYEKTIYDKLRENWVMGARSPLLLENNTLKDPRQQPETGGWMTEAGDSYRRQQNQSTS